MVSMLHTYDERHCYMCKGTCLATPPVRYYAPKEMCPHPREFLVQMWHDVCDPDLVTVCNRCGLSFPGQTVEDLLAA